MFGCCCILVWTLKSGVSCVFRHTSCELKKGWRENNYFSYWPVGGTCCDKGSNRLHTLCKNFALRGHLWAFSSFQLKFENFLSISAIHYTSGFNSSPRAPPLCTFCMFLSSLQTFVLFDRKCPAKWTSQDIPPSFQFEASVYVPFKGHWSVRDVNLNWIYLQRYILSHFTSKFRLCVMTLA